MPTGLEPDSPFETAVIRMLRDYGWVVHPQVGCSGYRIDIGVVDPRAPGRYLLGIECDGRSYHSGATARDRDRLRQHVLEGLGWRIHRIWSTDWWMDPEGQIKKMTVLLQNLLAEESAQDTQKQPIADTPSVHENPVVVTEAPDTPYPAAPIAAIPMFTPVVLDSHQQRYFYDHHSASILTAQILQVVEGEGPISDTLLFRKIARSWGLERTGSRIVERLKALIPASVYTTQEGSVIFYWALHPV